MLDIKKNTNKNGLRGAERNRPESSVGDRTPYCDCITRY